MCVNLCWQSGSLKKEKTVSISFIFSSFVLPPSISVICSFIPLPLQCYRPFFVCVFMHSCLLESVYLGLVHRDFSAFLCLSMYFHHVLCMCAYTDLKVNTLVGAYL